MRRLLPLVLIPALLFPSLWASGCSNANNGSLTTSGTIQATETLVVAEVAGKIEGMPISEGGEVGRGETIAKLEATAIELQLKQAQAAVNLAEARLAEARAGARPEQIRQAEELAKQADASFAGARKNYETTARLYGEGAASRVQMDAATTQMEAAEANAKAAHAQADLVKKGSTPEQIRQIESALEQAVAAADLARFNLDRTTVKAPVGGVVTRKLLGPGALVAPGSAIAVLIDPNDLWLRVYVPENRLGALSLNARADVEVDAFPGKRFKAEVIYIADKAEFTPRNVQTKEERATTVFAVKLRLLEGLDGQLKPGMPADVTFNPPATGGR